MRVWTGSPNLLNHYLRRPLFMCCSSHPSFPRPPGVPDIAGLLQKPEARLQIKLCYIPSRDPHHPGTCPTGGGYACQQKEERSEQNQCFLPCVHHVSLADFHRRQRQAKSVFFTSPQIYLPKSSFCVSVRGVGIGALSQRRVTNFWISNHVEVHRYGSRHGRRGHGVRAVRRASPWQPPYVPIKPHHKFRAPRTHSPSDRDFISDNCGDRSPRGQGCVLTVNRGLMRLCRRSRVESWGGDGNGQGGEACRAQITGVAHSNCSA